MNGGRHLDGLIFAWKFHCENYPACFLPLFPAIRLTSSLLPLSLMSNPFSAFYGVPPNQGGVAGVNWFNVSSTVQFSCVGQSSWVVNGALAPQVNWTTSYTSLPKLLLANWDTSLNGTAGACVVSMCPRSSRSCLFLFYHTPLTATHHAQFYPSSIMHSLLSVNRIQRLFSCSSTNFFP